MSVSTISLSVRVYRAFFESIQKWPSLGYTHFSAVLPKVRWARTHDGLKVPEDISEAESWLQQAEDEGWSVSRSKTKSVSH